MFKIILSKSKCNLNCSDAKVALGFSLKRFYGTLHGKSGDASIICVSSTFKNNHMKTMRPWN